MTEEEDFFPDRKQAKKERKLLQKKDRSKFKTSVLSKKKEEKIWDPSLHQGKVCTIFSDRAMVYSDGQPYFCSLKGLLKKERSKKKNLVIIGDLVLFEKFDTEGVIYHVLPRTTLLSRKAKQAHQEQLIAANVDQVLITCTLSSPPLDIGYLDRSIIACYKGKMQPVIVINKIDLARPPPQFCETYKKLKIPLICTSTKTKEGLKDLEHQLLQKTSVFVGLSGVGKSSLLNAMFHLELPSNEVAKKTSRGKHTTTCSCLIPVANGGFCIDTPGIQNFGIWELEKKDLLHFFQEIAKNSKHCRYANCTHVHEPGCLIKQLVQEEKIPAFRLDSYHLLLKEISK